MRCRVLVVEDDPELAEVLGEILSLEKMESVQAKSRAQAMEILGVDSSFHLILLDWDLLEMDGSIFVQELASLKQKHPRFALPIVVVGGVRPALPPHCIYCEKPFSISHLIATLRQALKSS